MREHKTSLDLAVSYTPPGSELSLTLAIVQDTALLIAVLHSAIEEAGVKADTEVNAVAAAGYRHQRDFLRKCLDEITAAAAAEWPALQTSGVM